MRTKCDDKLVCFTSLYRLDLLCTVTCIIVTMPYTSMYFVFVFYISILSFINYIDTRSDVDKIYIYHNTMESSSF